MNHNFLSIATFQHTTEYFLVDMTWICEGINFPRKILNHELQFKIPIPFYFHVHVHAYCFIIFYFFSVMWNLKLIEGKCLWYLSTFSYDTVFSIFQLKLIPFDFVRLILISCLGRGCAIHTMCNIFYQFSLLILLFVK